MRKRLVFIIPLAIVGMVVFVTIGGEVVRLLWNWLAPALFRLPQITFWQALGLLALCRILFGGVGLGGGSGRSGRRRRMAERCEHMTPEEREGSARAFVSVGAPGRRRIEAGHRQQWLRREPIWARARTRRDSRACSGC